MRTTHLMVVCALLFGFLVFSHRAEAEESERSKPLLLEGRAEVSRFDSGVSDEQTELAETELTIEWDKWHNRFAKAVWARFNEKLAGGDAVYVGPLLLKFGNAPFPTFAKGLAAEYYCEINNDRRIVNAKIERSSGNRQLDNMILASVLAVNGKKVLAFPEGSKRTSVNERGYLKIGKRQFHPSVFQDREVVRNPIPYTDR